MREVGIKNLHSLAAVHDVFGKAKLEALIIVAEIDPNFPDCEDLDDHAECLGV